MTEKRDEKKFIIFFDTRYTKEFKKFGHKCLKEDGKRSVFRFTPSAKSLVARFGWTNDEYVLTDIMTF